jgi:regulator of RNase E activity RraA
MPAYPIVIRRPPPRPDPALFSALAGVHTGFVVDAQDRCGAMDCDIRPFTDATDFTGTALTVMCRPGDNLAAHTALAFIEPGDVLVIATSACRTSAVLGEKMIGMARNAGAVAVVTDGMIRDPAGINRIGIPVFARGVISNSAIKNGPGEIGLPASIGSSAIECGDVLVGRADGIVHVRRSRLGDLRAALAKVVESETAMFDRIAAGGAKPDAMAAITEQVDLRFVD